MVEPQIYAAPCRVTSLVRVEPRGKPRLDRHRQDCQLCRKSREERMPWRLWGAALALLLAAPGAASAQAYPIKPVTMIIPFAAGGPTDVLGRVMAQRMSEILGQQ